MARDSGAPVVGCSAPQGREYDLAVLHQTTAIAGMADAALGFVHLFTASVVWFLLRVVQFRIATAIDWLGGEHFDAFGQPLMVSSQGQHIVTAILRWQIGRAHV